MIPIVAVLTTTKPKICPNLYAKGLLVEKAFGSVYMMLS